MFKSIIQSILKFSSKLILKKYQPTVVAITGSVGKTTTKEAIAVVLAVKFKVRQSLKNYNNEFGLPLSIIGLESGGKSILAWVPVFFKILSLLLIKDKNYPQILILEMGIDKIGDMDYLCKIVKPNVAVITGIGQSHLEFFGTIANLQKEKGKLVKNVVKNGWAVLNYDNIQAREIAKMNSKINYLFYGSDRHADIFGQEINYLNFDIKNILNNKTEYGANFKLTYKGSATPVMLPKVLGEPAIKAALAAASVGYIYGLNSVEISQALRKLVIPKGRLNLISGVKKTLILDDTYNASPQAVIAAIESAKNIKLENGAKRWAILGDMLELGSASEEGHRQVGQKIAKSKFKKLIVVGERARDIARGAKSAGMNEDDIYEFANTQEAGVFAENRIKEGDLILVKGSQGTRMEKIVLELMAEPNRANELLVRQGKEWK